MLSRIRPAVACAIVALAASSAPAQPGAPKYPERWSYVSTPLTSEEWTVKTLQALETSKATGCTHVLLVYSRTCRLHLPGNETYLARVERVRRKAAELGLKLALCVLPTGYAGQYPFFDGNLLAGLPVKEMPFVVRGKRIVPDPEADLPIANAGFEESEGDTLAGWANRTLPGKNSFADTAEKHSGKASWRVANLPEMRKVDRRRGGVALLSQKIKVKPFQYYRVSYWTKAAGKLYPNGLTIASDKPMRGLIYSGIPIRRDKTGNVSTWTRAEVTFNTLTSEEITLSLGVVLRGGTAWFDDIQIAPAGPVLIVRREECPLTVTSADGKTAYQEGKDFKPLRDPVLCRKPFAGELDTKHDVPFELTDGSRIQDGQKLLVSFYHAMLISWDQQVLSLQAERVFEILAQDIKNALKYWQPEGIFFNYDEIRMGGWEAQPDGQNLTPGQILAGHVRKACAVARKVAPRAKLYTWSDMFTPYHNARPFRAGKHVNGNYWLARGNWDGSWEGLDKDVIIMNWYSPDDRTPKFFAERGHKQILCGYYDQKTTEGMKKNIRKWIAVTRQTPGVLGVMYTTWKKRSEPMREYFKLLDTYAQWAAEPAK